MKNILSIVLIIAILFAGLFILTGCENNTGKAGSNDGGVNLKLNMTHHNKKVYTAHIDLVGDQRVTEFFEDEPNTVRIESKEENYIIDLTLDEQAKGAMEEFQKTAKTKEKYIESKFGKYNGYSYLDNDDMVSEIVLDSSDENATIHLLVDFYIDNDTDDDIDNEEKDLEVVFKTANVQKLLNSISLKYETIKNTEK